METTKLLETISKKLGVLIALELLTMNKKATIAENVALLDRFGLSPAEIAEILNTSTNTVNVTRTRLKKGSKSKK